jgi:tetratricopeptide (TPR) repeat protein
MRLHIGLIIFLSASAFAEADGLPADLRRADELVRMGHATKALALLTQQIASHPDSLAAHVQYQDLCLALGRGGKLLTLYGARARSQAKSGEAVYLYARLLSGRRAVSLYRRAVRLSPNLAFAWADYARLLVDERRLPESIQAAEQAVRCGPKIAGCHEAYGWCLENTGHPKRAEDAYRRALELDGADLHARAQLADLLARTGRKTKATAELRTIQKQAPGAPRTAIVVGAILRTLGQHAEAAKTLRRAASQLPDDAFAHLILAGAFLDLGQLDDAMDAVDRARKLAPKLTASHAMAARICFARKRFPAAISACRKAIRLEPKQGDHEFLLAVCLEGAGKQRDAAKHFKLATKKAPDRIEYLLALGDAEDERGRDAAALKAYRKASERAPEDVDVWVRLGHLAADAGRGKESVRAFRRAIELDPKDVELWKVLGIVYQTELGMGKRAEECYRTYIEKGGTDKRVVDWLKRRS